MLSATRQRELFEFVFNNTSIEDTKREILKFLLELSVQASPGLMDAVNQEPILEHLGWPIDDEHRTKLRKVINSLKKDLRTFFGEKAGKRQSHRIEIANYTHVVSFLTNIVLVEDGLIQTFWYPYIHSELGSCLYYPEPQFFRDAHYTYIRNPAVNSPAAISRFSYMRGGGALKPSYSYVPSGLVGAMARLFEFFARQQTEITATGLGPYQKFQDDHEENRIFLGTPGTSLAMISNVGASLPLRTIRDGHVNAVIMNKEKGQTQYRDRIRPDRVREKHVVASRRFRLNSCTTCIAGHSRAVQGVVENLTRAAGITEFAKKFSNPENMKTDFQALFRVEMSESQGQLTILNVHVEQVLEQEQLVRYKTGERTRLA